MTDYPHHQAIALRLIRAGKYKRLKVKGSRGYRINYPPTIKFTDVGHPEHEQLVTGVRQVIRTMGLTTGHESVDSEGRIYMMDVLHEE